MIRDAGARDPRFLAIALGTTVVHWGHEVDEAEDGIRGLERLLATRPDVAFVDIGLPGRATARSPRPS